MKQREGPLPYTTETPEKDEKESKGGGEKAEKQ
jgi:hypothetical protein